MVRVKICVGSNQEVVCANVIKQCGSVINLFSMSGHVQLMITSFTTHQPYCTCAAQHRKLLCVKVLNMAIGKLWNSVPINFITQVIYM